MSDDTTHPSSPEAGAPLSLRDLDGAGRRQWLWDHSGRVAGMTLGFLAFASMVFLAAIGFHPALYLVVLLVVGVAMIALGGRIRGT